MKTLAILMLFCLSITAHAQPNNQIVLGIKDTCYSTLLNEPREIWVRLPDTTGTGGRKKYPVVYLLDGEVHFYGVAGILQFMSQVANECPETILVGIVNTNRMRDLTPTHDGTVPKDSNLVRGSGGGERFTGFLEKELIPFVEAHYPAAPYRVLLGHSLGGLLAVNSLINHTHLFNACIAADPALFWDNMLVVRQADSLLDTKLFPNRSLYLGWSGAAPLHKDSLLKDNSISTIVDRAQLTFVDLITKPSMNGLDAQNKYYPNEEHNSLPFVTFYDGLRNTFKFANPPKINGQNRQSATTDLYTQHYKFVSMRMGYTVLPPEELINGMGYDFMFRKMYARAREFFQLNIDNYPDSYNVYDSMSDLYAAEGNKPKAIEFLEKELKLTDLPYIRQKLADLAGKEKK